MYREQLFANEVMLLPYYIAALNIEHAYMERSGRSEIHVSWQQLHAQFPVQSANLLVRSEIEKVEL